MKDVKIIRTVAVTSVPTNVENQRTIADENLKVLIMNGYTIISAVALSMNSFAGVEYILVKEEN